MTAEKACKTCRRVLTGDKCPICVESQLTANWKGFVVVSNPEKSEVAKMLEIKAPGKYALRLGK
ncbi:MAG: transcription elongation factor subunit Spt4 [Candidatus Micrarchaeota archaeon]